MKDLLNGCREQLKQFEELNAMRNTVIEKLETDNLQLKRLAETPVKYTPIKERAIFESFSEIRQQPNYSNFKEFNSRGGCPPSYF
jgi:hypothetical protein